MKYESKRFHQDRWGSVQAEAKTQVVTTIVGGANTNDLGGTMMWSYPATGDVHVMPWDAPASQPVYAPIVPDQPFHPYDSGEQAKVELEVLRRSLSMCLICGLTDVFVLCSLCRETVREARQKMLNEMVESVRSIGE